MTSWVGRSAQTDGILFESASPLQILALVPRIRLAQRIYFLEQSAACLLEPRGVKRWLARKLIHLIHSTAKIKPVSPDILYPHLWRLNKESLACVDGAAKRIETSLAYRLGRAWLQDEEVIRYYQMSLAIRIPGRRLLWRLAEELAPGHRNLLVIPDGRYRHEAGEAPTSTAGMLLWVNRLRCRLRRLFNVALLIGLPFGFVLRRLFLFRASPIRKASFDVKVPVVSGFGGRASPSDRTRQGWDDGGLYGEGLTKGNIVHVLGFWIFPAETRRLYQQQMDARGLAWRDAAGYRMDAGFLRRVTWYQKTLLAHLWRAGGFFREDNDLLEITFHLLHDCLKQELERSNIEYAVEFIRNDYSPCHVVAMILGRRHGGRTVGVQHTASCYDLPQLAYTHLDHYVVFGELYVRGFGRYWEDLPLEKTGRENIDWVAQLIQDTHRHRMVQERFQAKYGPGRPVVLILFPSGFDWASRRKWEEMFEGLARLLGLPFEGRILLRLRSETHLAQYPHLERLKDLAGSDPRMALEHEDFTTQELMVVSDVVIANSASFAINEAIVTKAKVFTFDFLGTARFYFPDFGSDFILESADDLVDLFSRLQQPDYPFDCQWERLRLLGNYHADGGNRNRIRQVVMKALREARHGNDLLLERPCDAAHLVASA